METLHETWVWIDLELTGLDVEKDKVLEICVILTNNRLGETVEGPVYVIKEDQQVLDEMDDFVKNMHQKSGLTEEVLKSEVSLDEARRGILDFLSQNQVQNGILAGNSVHMDRLFLLKHFPDLFEGPISPFRLLDVSSLKTVYLLYKSKEEPLKKSGNHRALDDLKESIEELRFYLNSGFTDLFLMNNSKNTIS
jgi:oligoribonuclease